MRLTIKPALPPAEVAKVIEAIREAPATDSVVVEVKPDPLPPPVTPVEKIVRVPIDFGAWLKGWLRKAWPTIDTELAGYIPPLVVAMVDSEFVLTEDPVEPWAWFAWRGYFEQHLAATKGTTGTTPKRIVGAWGGPPRGPVDQIGALIVQSRGPDDPQVRDMIAAATLLLYAPSYPKVCEVLRDPDWRARFNALVT